MCSLEEYGVGRESAWVEGIRGVSCFVRVSWTWPSQVLYWVGFMVTCDLCFQVQWLIWDFIIRDIWCE